MDNQQQMQFMFQMMQQMNNNPQMNSNPMMNSMMNSMNQIMNNQNNMMNTQMPNNNMFLMTQLFQLMNQYNQLMQMQQYNNNNFNPLTNQINTMYNKIQNQINAGNQNFANNQNNKINVTFKTTYNTITNLPLDPDTTVDEMLSLYLKRVGQPDLINKTDGKIQFLYSASSLNFGDKRPIRNVFTTGGVDTIIVIDVGRVIGA